MLSRSLWDPLEVGTPRDLFVVWGINVRNLQSSWRAPDGQVDRSGARVLPYGWCMLVRVPQNPNSVWNIWTT